LFSENFPNFPTFGDCFNFFFGRGFYGVLKKINFADYDFFFLFVDATFFSRDFIDGFIIPLAADLLAIISTPQILYSSHIHPIWYAGGVVDLWRGFIFHIGI
jgi:hypothetical protein